MRCWRSQSAATGQLDHSLAPNWHFFLVERSALGLACRRQDQPPSLRERRHQYRAIGASFTVESCARCQSRPYDRGMRRPLCPRNGHCLPNRPCPTNDLLTRSPHRRVLLQSRARGRRSRWKQADHYRDLARRILWLRHAGRRRLTSGNLSALGVRFYRRDRSRIHFGGRNPGRPGATSEGGSRRVEGREQSQRGVKILKLTAAARLQRLDLSTERHSAPIDRRTARRRGRTAIDEQFLALHMRGIVRRQEQHRLGNVIGFTDAAERRR